MTSETGGTSSGLSGSDGGVTEFGGKGGVSPSGASGGLTSSAPFC